MYRFVTPIVLLFTVSSAPWLPAVEPGVTWHRDLTEAAQLSETRQLPLLLFLTTPGCAFCERMKQDTFAHEDVAKQLDKQFVTVLVDGKKYPQVARQLRDRVYPTTAIVDSSGNVLQIIAGYKSQEAFSLLLEKTQLMLDARLASKSDAGRQQ